MESIMCTFDTPSDGKSPPGLKKASVHIIFDIKWNVAWRSFWVKDIHLYSNLFDSNCEVAFP